jgi:hypothetical protein
MSKAINVQSGHYKVAGRERQGEDILQEQQRTAYTQQRKSMRTHAAAAHAGIPVWESTPPNLDFDRPPEPPAKRGRKRGGKKTAKAKAAKMNGAKQRGAKQRGAKQRGAKQRGAKQRAAKQIARKR